MTKQDQRKVIEELKPLWIQMAQKADQMGLDLFLTVRPSIRNKIHQLMMCENTDVIIKNGKIMTRYTHPEDPIHGVEEETTSLPAASEK